jgi:hypothetical protein
VLLSNVLPLSSGLSPILKMEVTGSCEMLVPIYQATWHHILEDHILNCHRDATPFRNTIEVIILSLVNSNCSTVGIQLEDSYERTDF